MERSWCRPRGRVGARFDGVVHGLGDDAAAADDEAVRTVADLGPLGCRRPLQEGDVALGEQRGVLEVGVGEFVGQQLRELADAVVSAVDPAPDEADDVGRVVAVEVVIDAAGERTIRRWSSTTSRVERGLGMITSWVVAAT